MDYEEIMEITNGVNVSEKDFEDINIGLSELEIKKTKNYLRKNTKNNTTIKWENHKRVKGIVAAMIAFIMISGTGLILSKPAFAEEIELFQGIYEKLGYYKEYKDYSQYIGETKEDNGYRFTIDDMVLTENKMIVTVKVNSDKAFDKDFDIDGKETSVAASMIFITDFEGDTPTSSSGSHSTSYIDKYNAVVVYEHEIQGAVHKKRGNISIRLQTIDPNLDKINVKFDFKVDFSKAFNDSMNMRIDKRIIIGDGAVYLKEFQISPLGTFIKFSTDNLYGGNKFDLEVDGKIYVYRDWGESDGEAHTVFKSLTYNVMKKAKSINVIPIYSEHREFKHPDKDTVELSEYMKLPFSPNFIKEVHGQIYKIEKVQDKLRVYYDCGDNTLAELSQMSLGSKGNLFPKNIIEKDPENQNGYFIEVEYNVNKEYILWRATYRGPFKVGESIKIK